MKQITEVPAISVIDKGVKRDFIHSTSIGVFSLRGEKVKTETYETIKRLEQEDPNNPNIISLQLGLAGLLGLEDGEEASDLYKPMIKAFMS